MKEREKKWNFWGMNERKHIKAVALGLGGNEKHSPDWVFSTTSTTCNLFLFWKFSMEMVPQFHSGDGSVAVYRLFSKLFIILQVIGLRACSKDTEGM